MVPGIGTIQGLRVSSQAKATWADVACFRDRDLPDLLDARLICLPHFGREAGRDAPHIRFVELRVRADGPGEESLSERGERNKADAELLKGRQDLLLRLSPPKRILALQGCHRLHRVRPADGSHAGFGQPEMPDLALLDQVLDGSRHVFDRHGRIDAMLIEQIDAVGPEPFQRRVGDLLMCSGRLFRPSWPNSLPNA